MTTKEVTAMLGCSAKTVDRYVQKGALNPKKIKNKYVYSREEVLSIAGNYIRNRKQQIGKAEAPKAPPMEAVKTFIEDKPAKDVMNANGEQELLRITQYLKDNGLDGMVDKGVLMRYAIAVQMQHQYLPYVEDDAASKAMYEMFTKQVMAYEKSLGLTPESLSRLKPPVKEETVVDPLEDMLG